MGKYFGTDGIRDIANIKLTPSLSYKIAKSATYVISKEIGHRPTILIGRDTRISGNLIESAMISGFLSCGANVKLLGVIPTPAVAYLTKKLNADIAVVISASHNSYEFNGIKFFSKKGIKIPDELEEKIEDIMENYDLETLNVSHDKIGICENLEYFQDEYVEYICSLFKENISKYLNNNFKVIIDTANGATYKIAEKIFSKLNINYDIINNTPNGININKECGSTHLENLKENVINKKYDLGIAYDGDGDRCLLIDNFGNIVDGDIIITILSKYFKEKGKLNNNTIVATIMSNLGLKKYAENNNLNLVTSNVGDRYVIEKMIEGEYNLGGEQSGHVILSDYNTTGDGILTSLMVISCLLEKSISLNEASQIITIYPQALVNAKVDNSIKKQYKDNPNISNKIKELENEFLENGRVIVRPSGTEPLIRVMIEGENIEYITQRANELARFIEENLK